MGGWELQDSPVPSRVPWSSYTNVGADAAEGGSVASMVPSSLQGCGGRVRCILELPGGQHWVWGLNTTLLLQCEVLCILAAGVVPGSSCFSSQCLSSSESQTGERGVLEIRVGNACCYFYIYPYQPALFVLLSPLN